MWLSQTGRIEIIATDPRLAGAKAPASIQESPAPAGSNQPSPRLRRSAEASAQAEDPASYEAYLAVNGTLQSLPMGSSFDKTTGTFMWQPVAGFLGAFPIRIVRVSRDSNGRSMEEEQWTTRVVVSPGVDDVLLQVDSADSSVIEGWSLDPQATKGSGIGAVHVWATKKVSGVLGAGSPDVQALPAEAQSAQVGAAAPFFVGEAGLGFLREDVGERYGSQFNASGYKLHLPMLEPGTYEVVVYAWSERTTQWEAARVTTVTVR